MENNINLNISKMGRPKGTTGSPNLYNKLRYALERVERQKEEHKKEVAELRNKIGELNQEVYKLFKERATMKEQLKEELNLSWAKFHIFTKTQKPVNEFELKSWKDFDPEQAYEFNIGILNSKDKGVQDE